MLDRERRPRIVEHGWSRDCIDRIHLARLRREEARKQPPAPPRPAQSLAPLLVVGVLFPGAFADVLPDLLTGIVPTPRGALNTTLIYLRTNDPESAGGPQIRRLVRLGFQAFANSGVVRRLRCAQALVEDDLIGNEELKSRESPWIAYYRGPDIQPTAILELPPRLWSSKAALQQLRTVLRTDLSSARILDLWRRFGDQPSTLGFESALKHHVAYVARTITRSPRGSPRNPRTTKATSSQRSQVYLQAVSQGFAPLRSLCREFDVPHTSALRLVRQIPDSAKRMEKGRLVITRTAFSDVLRADGRPHVRRRKRRSRE